MSEPSENGAARDADSEPGDGEAQTTASAQADAVDAAPEAEELIDSELGPGWVVA